MMRTLFIAGLSIFAISCSGADNETQSADGSSTDSVNGLATAASFDTIRNDRERAVAIFEEMGKVIQHPRCMNCHPRGDRPMQGDASLPHQPLVVRGDGGMGAAGMRCTTCHGSENFANVPGRPVWFLAPAEMAWQGKSLGEICAQIKDPERNGQRSLDDIAFHAIHDELVAYGWEPPAHLESAPGDQATFGALVEAWIGSGAHCPVSSDT